MKIKKRLVVFLILIGTSFQNLYSQYDVPYFINKAKKNSPLIYKLAHQSELINLDFNQTKTALTKPQISVNANLLIAPIISTDNNKNQLKFFTENAINYYGYDLSFSDGGQYQATLEINKPLLNSKKIQTFEQKAAILQQENTNKIKRTSKELEYMVKYQYLLCLIAQKEIDFAEKNTALFDKEINIMEKLVENAIYQPDDLSILRIEQKNYILKSEKYKALYKQNLSNLFILCGIKDTTNIILEDINFTLNSGNLDNIFIEKYTTDSLKTTTNLKINNVKYKPELFAYANTGINAVYLPNYNRFGISAGFKFSWLLYDGRQANIMKQKSKILLNNINFEKQKVINKNKIRNYNVIQQIKAIDQQILQRNKQINDYNNLLKIYKIKIAQGSMSIINYTEILNKISNIENEKLLLKMQKQILIINYNYWNE